VVPNSRAARPRRRRSRLGGVIGPILPPALVLTFLLCSSFAINAELVVFTTGDVMKVSAFEIEQGDILLQLGSRGRLRIPIGRIERILDDEIVEALAPPVPVAPPPFELGFLDTHPVPTAPYGSLIHDVARRHRVNPELVTAMVRWESSFDPYATSPRGAQGLMQLMPATAERYGVTGDRKTPLAKKLTDPRTNIKTGVRYLRYLIDLFPGRLDLALAAYNAGEGAVQRAGNKVPKYRETQNYVKTVMQLYTILKPPSMTPRHLKGRTPGRVRVQLPGPPNGGVYAPATIIGGAANRGNLPSRPLRQSQPTTVTTPGSAFDLAAAMQGESRTERD
jgi:hypothetical protein